MSHRCHIVFTSHISYLTFIRVSTFVNVTSLVIFKETSGQFQVIFVAIPSVITVFGQQLVLNTRQYVHKITELTKGSTFIAVYNP